MTETVVVGVDGSETARKAAVTAQQLAIGAGATLHIVTAFDNDRTDIVGSGSDQVAVTGRTAAEGIARCLALELNSPKLKVAYFAVQGSPTEALIKHAEHHRAKIIVVGNKRMRGLGRVLGSVANSVAHNAPCDVYVAKTDES